MQDQRYKARSSIASALAGAAALSSCGTPHQLSPTSSSTDAQAAQLPKSDATGVNADVAGERALDISLTPQRVAGEVVRLDVTLRYAVPPVDLGDSPPAFRVSQEDESESGVAEQIEDLHAQDAVGALALHRSVVQEDGAELVQWQSDRLTRGPISLSYGVRVSRAEPARIQGMRALSGGFFGRAMSTLPLLKTAQPYRVRLHWDRSQLGADDRTVSSFGAGDVEVTVPLEELAATLFMAGPLGRLVIDDGYHFEATWLGKPALEPLEALSWAARFYGITRTFFRDPAPSSYTLFLSVAPPLYDSWRGSAHATGIIIRLGPVVHFNADLRFLLAHEMTHRWLGKGLRLGGPEGSAYWFTEGFTVYYTGRIMLRSGLGTADEFLKDLNNRVERFATSPVQSVTNEELTKQAMTNRDYERLAYDRGLLYAAEVDAAIRTQSAGKRSLDDLMLDLMAQGRTVAGGQIGWKELAATAFREAIGRELGPAGEARYDAVIVHGALPSPPADAFGPCFHPVQKKYYKYELGLDIDILIKEKRAAQVRPGSAVARAGIKEGERIPNAAIHVGQANYPVELSIERNGKVTTIKYLPRGHALVGMGWERVPKVEDTACAR